MLVELLLIFLAVVLVGAAAGEVLAVVKHLRATERMEDAVNRLVNVVANPDQAWYWTDEWQRGEREADEAIAEGRLVGTMTTEEFLAWVDRVHAEAKARAAA
ncbi:MAG: hypothetical protein FWJ70_17435 [Micromonosporaceae bacterium]|jgi:hypothetical protein|nr:hypothetical protein [Natronosporangium sp.]